MVLVTGLNAGSPYIPVKFSRGSQQQLFSVLENFIFYVGKRLVVEPETVHPDFQGAEFL